MGELLAAEIALQLPQNPLHFRSHSNVETDYEEEDMEEEDNPFRMMPPSGRFTIRLVSEGLGRPGRRQGVITQRSSASTKAKAFFDNLINIPSPDSSAEKNRHRIIYIRDYPLLAPSASSWYSSLLASVRQRRQGPISRPTSPVANPVTIVFGMTPPIVQSSSSSSSTAGRGRRPSPQGLLGLLNSRQPSDIVVSPPQKPERTQGDDEHAEKARERRLRDRMARWVKEDPSFYDELPPLPDLSSESSPTSTSAPSGMIIGSPVLGGLPPGVSAAISSMMGGSIPMSSDSRDGSDKDFNEVDPTQYFRTSIIIPEVRNVAEEREARVFRRVELNLLIMRMAIGEVDARIDETDPGNMSEFISPVRVVDGEEGGVATGENLWDSMWRDWAEHIQPWSTAKNIADRAVGVVLASNGPFRAKTLSDSVLVPWSVISHTWKTMQRRKDYRKEVIKQSWSKVAESQKLFGETEEDEQVEPDTVIEDVKESPDLSPHERRLLSCIIDSGELIEGIICRKHS